MFALSAPPPYKATGFHTFDTNKALKAMTPIQAEVFLICLLWCQETCFLINLSDK